MGLKIQISMPSSDKPELECVNSLFDLYHETFRKTPHTYYFRSGKRMFIHFARKAMVETAILSKADYIIFLDDDMIFPPNAIIRMVTLAEKYGYDCVSGIYSRRGAPFDPLMMQQVDDTIHYTFHLPTKEYRNHAVECHATGLGCCLFRTSVFEKIEKPWFELPDGMTEDTYFFQKMHRAGIPCHMDTGIVCGHIGTRGIVFPYRTPFTEAVGNDYHKIYSEEYIEENNLLAKGDENVAG